MFVFARPIYTVIGVSYDSCSVRICLPHLYCNQFELRQLQYSYLLRPFILSVMSVSVSVSLSLWVSSKLHMTAQSGPVILCHSLLINRTCGPKREDRRYLLQKTLTTRQCVCLSGCGFMYSFMTQFFFSPSILIWLMSDFSCVRMCFFSSVVDFSFLLFAFFVFFAPPPSKLLISYSLYY